jgi:ribosome maturation factor RimP
MRKPETLLEAIGRYAGGLVADMGLELVDVQYRREGHGWVLRLYIDSEQGITIDDCAAVSREISAWLDVEDLIDQAYHLEVSSPGLDRPLTRMEHFARFTGQKARIKLKEPREGRRVYTGIIQQAEGDRVVLMVDGSPVDFGFAEIAAAKLAG